MGIGKVKGTQLLHCLLVQNGDILGRQCDILEYIGSAVASIVAMVIILQHYRYITIRTSDLNVVANSIVPEFACQLNLAIILDVVI